VPTMRIPRSVVLTPHVAFHKMWQCHDRQHLRAADEAKRLYLDQLFRFKPKAVEAGVLLFAFAVMYNHVHECGAVGDDARPFSDWMRVSHGTFGGLFNRRLGRRGKVAIERPKTVVLEDERAVLQVMLYMDVNPVAAGLVADAADWPWSSHRFYAFGETNEWTSRLDVPDAYLSLGETPEARQRAYRSLYEEYVHARLAGGDEVPTPGGEGSEAPAAETTEATGACGAAGTSDDAGLAPRRWHPGDPEIGPFFGAPAWVQARSEALKAWREQRRARKRSGATPSAPGTLAA